VVEPTIPKNKLGERRSKRGEIENCLVGGYNPSEK
jgi:hypothetical protein